MSKSKFFVTVGDRNTREGFRSLYTVERVLGTYTLISFDSGTIGGVWTRRTSVGWCRSPLK